MRETDIATSVVLNVVLSVLILRVLILDSPRPCKYWQTAAYLAFALTSINSLWDLELLASNGTPHVYPLVALVLAKFKMFSWRVYYIVVLTLWLKSRKQEAASSS